MTDSLLNMGIIKILNMRMINIDSPNSNSCEHGSTTISSEFDMGTLEGKKNKFFRIWPRPESNRRSLL